MVNTILFGKCIWHLTFSGSLKFPFWPLYISTVNTRFSIWHPFGIFAATSKADPRQSCKLFGGLVSGSLHGIPTSHQASLIFVALFAAFFLAVFLTDRPHLLWKRSFLYPTIFGHCQPISHIMWKRNYILSSLVRYGCIDYPCYFCFYLLLQWSLYLESTLAQNNTNFR